MRKTAHRALHHSGVLRRDGLYKIFFGFVTAYRESGATWDDAAARFMQRFGLSEEDIDPDTLKREAQRMTTEFVNHGL